MLLSAVLSSFLFLLLVQCASSPGPTGFEAFQAAEGVTCTDTSQAHSSIDALQNTMSDSPDPPLVRTNAISPDPNHPSQVTNDSASFLVMTYYPGWAGANFPPEKIDFGLLDWIDFAFAVPNDQNNLTWESEDAPILLGRLVRAAHAAGTKVKLSIGGWTGSKSFSSAVATNVSRDTLSMNIRELYDLYDMDGIDIDWEYPGHEGASGNKVDPSDSENFLSFLWCLRKALPPTARITAAAQTVPFTDSVGRTMSEFADVLDWILLMNYDTHPSSPYPGPNAPLYDSCKNSSQPEGSALAALKAWTAAGFPSSQLVLGVPSYGYLSQSDATALKTRSNSSSSVTVVADGSQIQFRDLVAQGALVCTTRAKSDGPCSYVASGGFQRSWDVCSATPFLHSSSARQVITYDDPTSLGMKAQFARELKFRGVNMFSIDGDTDEWDLIKSVKNLVAHE